MKRKAISIFIISVASVSSLFAHARPWEESSPDAASIQHPRRMFILWRPDTRLEFMFPAEKERSGVANLFFRDRGSGEIVPLDATTGGPFINMRRSGTFRRYYVDTLKYPRYHNRIAPGSYDIILLYNNGNYLVHDNIDVRRGTDMIVDMTGSELMPADGASREWLKLRKFTDALGGRIPHDTKRSSGAGRVLGYMFHYGGGADGEGHIEDKENGRRATTSTDGYFEVDTDGDTISRLYFWSDSSDHPFEMDLDAGSWLFIVWDNDAEHLEGQLAGS